MKNRHGQMDQDLFVMDLKTANNAAEIIITQLIACLEDFVDYNEKRFDDYKMPVDRAKRWLLTSKL